MACCRFTIGTAVHDEPITNWYLDMLVEHWRTVV